MYYKRILTICGVIQLLCGLIAILLFVLEWKLFGLLIPVYAVGIIHVFCGAWCLVEVYRKAYITASLYTMGACISAVSMAVAITLIAVSSVDLKDVKSFSQIYRTPTKDNAIANVDHGQVLIGFGFAFLLLGLTAVGAAATQFLTCIMRLVRGGEAVSLPTRMLEHRLSLKRKSDPPAYKKMIEDQCETEI